MGRLQLVFLLLFTTFLVLIPTRVFGVCNPAVCQWTGNGDCNWDTEYCLDYCCVEKPTGAVLPTIPSGGSYTYQRCATGEYLSCGTTTEAASQNKSSCTYSIACNQYFGESSYNYPLCDTKQGGCINAV